MQLHRPQVLELAAPALLVVWTLRLYSVGRALHNELGFALAEALLTSIVDNLYLFTGQGSAHKYGFAFVSCHSATVVGQVGNCQFGRCGFG